jgi:short-subunit dehydrogenase involved in D-alanine esterification of teichoic acids
MDKTTIIYMVSVIVFSSTVGTYTVYRLIKKNTHTPTNLLRRQHQDIELNVIEPIEPTHPSRIYNQVDSINYERVPDYNS